MSDLRTRLFNNEYFNTLAQKPSKVKDGQCIGGNLRNPEEPAEGQFHPFATLFPFTWNPPKPWSTETRVGEISWRMQYIRGPLCGRPERMTNEDKKIFWNGEIKHQEKYGGSVKELAQLAPTIRNPDTNRKFNDGWDLCCWVADNPDTETWSKNMKKLMPDNIFDMCTLDVKDRKRFLSSEVGYYFDFTFDQDGMPRGCEAFEKRVNPSKFLIALWIYRSLFSISQ